MTAIRVDAQQAYTAKSDAAGVFTLLYLLPGKYTVTVDAPSFQKTVYNNVTLESAQKLNLVFYLSVLIFPLAVVGFGLATWWKRR